GGRRCAVLFDWMLPAPRTEVRARGLSDADRRGRSHLTEPRAHGDGIGRERAAVRRRVRRPFEPRPWTGSGRRAVHPGRSRRTYWRDFVAYVVSVRLRGEAATARRTVITITEVVRSISL